MLTNSVLMIIGFVLLTYAADRFVAGSAAIARNFGLSPLVIGLTIVALGTSAPELFVSITAALQGNAGLAVGNVIGSNIANIGLVLGVSAMIAPLSVHSKVLRREYPILFFIMLLTWSLMLDGDLDRFDGIILLICCVLLMAGLAWLALSTRNHEPMTQEYEQEYGKPMATRTAVGWFIFGLILLPLSSKLIVFSAVEIAKVFGMSDLIIGLTIVALGTSLPEVAASIIGAIKGEHDIAIGNILGSNMFNLVAVLPFAGLIDPHILDTHILTRDIPVMLGVTIILFIVAYGFRGPGHITRWEGILLIACYVSYIAWLIYSASIL